METLTLKINGQTADIDSSFKLTLNCEAFSLDDPTSRSKPYSYSSTIPLTKLNSKLMGYIDNLPVKSKFLKDVKVEVLDGGNLLIKGYMYIDSIAKGYVDFNIVSDQLDWASVIGTKKLSDLPDTYSFPFTAVYGDGNSNSQFNDGDRYQDYLSSNRGMQFPLISYGNFYQRPKLRMWKIEGVSKKTYLGKGLYLTDDNEPFYVDSEDTIRPSNLFDDGEIVEIGGLTYQAVLDDPLPDNEIVWSQEFTVEEYTPSFNLWYVLEAVFKSNGFNLSSSCKGELMQYVLPYVGDRFVWNWGTIGEMYHSTLALARVTPSTGTYTIDKGGDLIDLPDFYIADPSAGGGETLGTYRDTIGGEPCSQWTLGTPTHESFFDNYKDGAWIVEEPNPGVVAPWWGQLFLINNTYVEGGNNHDFTENYTRYLGLTVTNNLPENYSNLGHYYRAPETGTYSYVGTYGMSIVGYDWNPNNYSRKFTGEHLPLFFCLIKNQEFEEVVKWLYDTYVNDTPISEGSDSNLLYHQDLVGSDNIVFSETGNVLNVNQQFDLERDDTVTACFIYFQASTRYDEPTKRFTGQHDYALIQLDSVQVNIAPLLDEEIYLNKNVVNMSQIDLVKNVMRLFNLFPVYDGNTVYLKSFKDYKLDRGDDWTDRFELAEITHIGIKDKLSLKWVEDSSDYINLDSFDQDEKGYLTGPGFADYEKTLFTGKEEFSIDTLFAATASRNFVMGDMTGNGIPIQLSSIATEDSVDTDPRYVDWTYSFAPRLVKYKGYSGGYINLYGVKFNTAYTEFPSDLYMKQLYNSRYERIIDRINESDTIEGYIYLTLEEYRLMTQNLLIVTYSSVKYAVASVEYDSISKRSKVSLLKL